MWIADCGMAERRERREGWTGNRAMTVRERNRRAMRVMRRQNRSLMVGAQLAKLSKNGCAMVLRA